MPHGAIARRFPAGPFYVGVRHNLFIPVAIRGFLGIECGDRLVLVASPRTGVLVVHPMTVVSALLDRFYRTLPGSFDAQ